MADAPLVTLPDYTSYVDQRFFIAPLGGPRHPVNYLDRFPEEVYNKAIDSHLVKFMYALLGPAGAGWLRKNYLQARLLFEDHGLELFDLDRFYGNPLAFGRILEEIYDEDPNGLLSHERWQEIRAKDAKYRNRAIDYLNGVRAGNTPEGMRLVAKSGLGHDVEIIEHYRYLYDQTSDDPLGLPSFGKTNSTEEMVVLPRREISRSERQTITITGSPTGGTFHLEWGPSATDPLDFDITRDELQLALEAIPTIGVGQVVVSGGPAPDLPFEILFTGSLANRDVAQLRGYPNFTEAGAAVYVTTEVGGTDATDEIVHIADRDLRYLQGALDRIKSVTTIPTVGEARGLQQRQVWNSAWASSEYTEVLRYVTGSVGIIWPPRDKLRWIERGVEHEARQVYNDLAQHYIGFHNVAAVTAYRGEGTEIAQYETDDWPDFVGTYQSEHLGVFHRFQQFFFGHLAAEHDSDKRFVADRCLADYPEPLTITNTTRQDADEQAQLVNGIYPAEYQNLKGVPPVKYPDEQFWASVEREEGDEYLEIDLGRPQAVNYLSFEISRKPIDIEVTYDVLDLAPRRHFANVKLINDRPSTTAISFGVQEQNPWTVAEVNFTASNDTLIFTRFVRIRFSRRNDINSPFYNQATDTVVPWSIEVRNLRVGRNVT